MFGKRIKLLRESNKMSQVALARTLGVSKQSVSNWENGNVLPSILMLKSLCKIFSCSADFILGLQGEKSLYLDVSDLTKSQISQITQLMNEYTNLNNKIRSLEHTTNETDITTTDDI